MNAGGGAEAGPGLWREAELVARRAVERGGLRPVATHCESLPTPFPGGGAADELPIRFQIRIVDSLRHKPRGSHRKDADVRTAGGEEAGGKEAGGEEAGGEEAGGENPTPGRENPFLPYDQELFVGDLPPGHACLLNKFPVISRHLLIVTRQFEHQELPLNLGDFQALAAAMRGTECLGFYNGGREAGASQTHKHLQLVPLPLGDAQLPSAVERLPIEPLLENCRGPGSGGATTEGGLEPAVHQANLPFQHGLVFFDAAGNVSSDQTARRMQAAYERLCEGLGLWTDASGRLPAYNLLVTHRWLLLVPRRRESWNSISINALGFAGALLVRDQHELERVRQAGAWELLRTVAHPR